jgi:uncharacterized coiled-coil DUF342 family protein
MTQETMDKLQELANKVRELRQERNALIVDCDHKLPDGKTAVEKEEFLNIKRCAICYRGWNV